MNGQDHPPAFGSNAPNTDAKMGEKLLDSKATNLGVESNTCADSHSQLLQAAEINEKRLYY